MCSLHVPQFNIPNTRLLRVSLKKYILFEVLLQQQVNEKQCNVLFAYQLLSASIIVKYLNLVPGNGSIGMHAHAVADFAIVCLFCFDFTK